MPNSVPGGGRFIVHDIELRRLDKCRVFAFNDDTGAALVHGDPSNGVLVRVQSACQYGEIFGSTECDCRAQLDRSMKLMKEAGSGVLIHLLNQEGRGAGLATKAKAYRLRKEEGLNTFDAYRKLKAAPDTRVYRRAIELLRDELGLDAITLLTNNPSKIDAFRRMGIKIVRRPLVTIASRECAEYWATKVAHGHLKENESDLG